MSSRSFLFLWHDGRGFVLLAVVSFGIGLLFNGLRTHPLPLVYTTPESRLGRIAARISSAHGSSVSTVGSWQNIELDAFQNLVSAHRGVAIDARPPSFYRAGHVPGALNLPREDFEQAYAETRATLASDKERAIVVYCAAADCRDSELVADTLSRLGYRRVFVYKEGWDEWLRAGLPQEIARAL